jgi:hypothetical protein
MNVLILLGSFVMNEGIYCIRDIAIFQNLKKVPHWYGVTFNKQII